MLRLAGLDAIDELARRQDGYASSAGDGKVAQIARHQNAPRRGSDGEKRLVIWIGQGDGPGRRGRHMKGELVERREQIVDSCCGT
jgi:hypothetical protein